jgi:hypothetical protein
MQSINVATPNCGHTKVLVTLYACLCGQIPVLLEGWGTKLTLVLGSQIVPGFFLYGFYALFTRLANAHFATFASLLRLSARVCMEAG